MALVGPAEGKRRFGAGAPLAIIAPDELKDSGKGLPTDLFVGPPEEIPTFDVYADRLKTLFTPRSPATKRKFIATVDEPPSSAERVLSRRAQKAIQDSQDQNLSPFIRKHIGVCHVARGTYFIKSIDPKVALALSNLFAEGAFEDSDDNALARQIFAQAKRQNIGLRFPKDPTLAGRELLDQLLGMNIQTIAVFKPADEVRGMPNSRVVNAIMGKDGVPPENEIPNEVIVSSLRQLSLRAIQTTLTGPFHVKGGEKEVVTSKTGALLPFVAGAADFNNVPEDQLDRITHRIPLGTVQDLAITDLSFCNADRNTGNILYSFETGMIHFIDNALVLPAGFIAGGFFTWMTWPQALQPFSQESLRKIRAMNFEQDLQKIQATYPDYPAGNLETMRIAYYLLKQGAEAGLSPFEIGWLMMDQPSVMATIYQTAKTNNKTDPQAAFVEMTQLIDKSVALLKMNFPTVKQEVIEEGIPETLFGESLIGKMHDLQSRFCSYT